MLILALRFETPGYLVLLAVLPLLMLVAMRSMSGLGLVRRTLAIILRVLVVTVMVLSLAGMQHTRKIDDLTVVYLFDRSRSIPEDLQREAFRFITRSADHRPLNDRIGVIAFNGTADVEQLPMSALALDQVPAPYHPDQTDIASAARLGLALLPSDSAGRVVLISDGNENSGSVLDEAEQYAAAGVPLDVLPVEYEHRDEVVFEDLKAPATATTSETINLQMVLRSQRQISGKILLYHNDTLVDLNGGADGAGYPVELQPGPNRREIPIPLRAAGPHRFQARFVPDDTAADTIVENNEGRAFTVVSGQGKVLILTSAQDATSDPSSAQILRRALETEKFVCVVDVAGATPIDHVRLLDYSVVILNNVAAGDLRDEEKQTLATYVRDLGGGLIMLGGEDSFGAGGWLGSPVEEVMPVAFDIKHKKQFIKGALVLCMHACEIERGNYIGERCAIEAVKTLSARDLVGILAWQWLGDQQGHWVVPLQPVGNRAHIVSAIKKMSMGDLPDLDEVMRPGVDALAARRDVGPKHMIVISDFDPQEPRPDLIRKMKAHGITCSTIAIGYGGHFINEKMANDIAEATGGRFYRTHDVSKLPQIFIKESREIRRELVQEGVFQPQVADPLSPLVVGIAGEAVPQLRGYVLATPRELATVPIVHPSEDADDPILAHWQAGLGKTVAFTSGMWPRWGPDWTSWPKFTKFWAQVVRWSSRQSAESAFDLTTTTRGGKAVVRIDAVDKNADAINFMEVAGRLVRPGDDATPLRLTQTGPGRYEAEFDARDRGNYILSLRYAMGRGAEASSGTLQTGLSIAYSPEYAQLAANVPLLSEISARTDGRLLGADQADRVFDRAGLPPVETRRPLWESLLHWMLVLFLLDVAVRRIALNPLKMLRNRLAEMAGRGRPQAETAAVLTTLRGTRDRLREQQRPAQGEPSTEAAPPPKRSVPTPTSPERSTRELDGAGPDRPVSGKPSSHKPPQSESDYLSRLRRAKRRARREMDEDDEGKQ